jgi:TRAP-type mannitol/chloroaromatic compound transport system permease large subunit
MGLDPVWLGIMIAINLQTSFLTPPFGFALFYLRGVAPATVTTGQIYRGVMPFVGIQLLALLILAAFPDLITWLPKMLYGQ